MSNIIAFSPVDPVTPGEIESVRARLRALRELKEAVENGSAPASHAVHCSCATAAAPHRRLAIHYFGAVMRDLVSAVRRDRWHVRLAVGFAVLVVAVGIGAGMPAPKPGPVTAFPSDVAMRKEPVQRLPIALASEEFYFSLQFAADEQPDDGAVWLWKARSLLSADDRKLFDQLQIRRFNTVRPLFALMAGPFPEREADRVGHVLAELHLARADLTGPPLRLDAASVRISSEIASSEFTLRRFTLRD